MAYTVLKYYGSKRRMVDPIRSFLPKDYNVWIEGCMGSGAVSINRDCPKGCMTNIVNEKGRGMYTFWKVLSDREKGLELMDMIRECNDSEQTFNDAHFYATYTPIDMDDVELAMYVYLDVVLSFSGTRSGYSRQERVRNFKDKVKGHIFPVYEKFQKEKVKVLNWDMLDLLHEIARQPEHIQRYIMVYLDPPYLPSLRAEGACDVYEAEMTMEDHQEMLEILQNIKCKVLLSGYFNEDWDTYSEHLLPYGYQCYFGGEFEKKCSFKKTDAGKEYLWCNYKLPEGATVEKVDYDLIWTP